MLKHSFAIFLVVSLLLSLTIPLMIGGLDSLSAIDRLPLSAIALLLAMILGSWCFGAARLQLLCRGLKTRLRGYEALATVISTEYAGMATPGGTGGPATLLVLMRRQGLAPAQGAAILVVDTLTDLGFFLTVLPVLLVIYLVGYATAGGVGYAGLLLGLLVAGLGLVWLIIRYYRTILLHLGRMLRPFPKFSKIRYRSARLVVQFRHAATLLVKMPRRQLLLLYLFSAGHWSMRYGVLPVLMWVLEAEIPWSYLLLLQPVLLAAGLAVVLPGGGGGVEVGYSLFISPYLDAAMTAFTLLAWRFCTFYWYLIVGTPVFLWYTGRAAHALLLNRQ